MQKFTPAGSQGSLKTFGDLRNPIKPLSCVQSNRNRGLSLQVLCRRRALGPQRRVSGGGTAKRGFKNIPKRHQDSAQQGPPSNLD